jgi:hypothetical protein
MSPKSCLKLNEVCRFGPHLYSENGISDTYKYLVRKFVRWSFEDQYGDGRVILR